MFVEKYQEKYRFGMEVYTAESHGDSRDNRGHPISEKGMH